METNYTIPNYIHASKTTRALNFLLDIIFMNIISVILYFIAAFITFNDEYYTLLNWFNSFDKAQDFLFWSLIMFLYYSILEILFARTFAKYITNTLVVMIDGSKPKPICILG